MTLIDFDGGGSICDAAAARPILFVHGWWGGAWVWELFRESFSKLGYQSTALNLSGALGERGRAIGELTTADHMDELRAAVDQLDDPVVIGHSFGGLLIQKLLEERDLPAAVLICPAPPRGVFALRSWELIRSAIRYAPNMFRGREFFPSRRDMLELNLNCLASDEQERVLSRMVPASGRQAFETAVVGVPVDASRVRTPMLVMVGGHDRLTTPSVCKAIARKYGADFRLYPDNAHYLMREPNHREIATDVHHWLCATLAERPAAIRP
jgi:pimeloyl-ACP methyl ester carboxylesterase